MNINSTFTSTRTAITVNTAQVWTSKAIIIIIIEDGAALRADAQERCFGSLGARVQTGSFVKRPPSEKKSTKKR